jgi:hypothetical protein
VSFRLLSFLAHLEVIFTGQTYIFANENELALVPLTTAARLAPSELAVRSVFASHLNTQGRHDESVTEFLNALGEAAVGYGLCMRAVKISGLSVVFSDEHVDAQAQLQQVATAALSRLKHVRTLKSLCASPLSYFILSSCRLRT